MLCLLNATELKRSELADYDMTQSLGAVVFINDQGEIEEPLRPDTVEVAFEMQKLAQQEEVGRGVADTDLDGSSGCVTYGFGLCEGAAE